MSMPRPLTGRLVWVDSAKGLGIILVALGHNGTMFAGGLAPLHQVIFWFHVPLFFFLSGLTAKSGDSLQARWSRLWPVLWSYVLISLLLTPLTLYKFSGSSFADVVGGMLYGTGLSIHLVPIWFVPCLVVSTVLLHVLLSTVARTELVPGQGAVIGLLAVVGGYIVMSHYPAVHHRIGWGSLAQGLPWSFDLTLAGAGFMLLGVSVQRARRTLLMTMGLMGGGVLLLMLVTGAYKPIKVDWNQRTVDGGAMAVALLGVLCCVMVVVFCQYICDRPGLLSYAGKNTLPILFMHFQIQNAVISSLGRNLWSAVLATLVGVLVPIFLARLLGGNVAWQFLFAPRALLSRKTHAPNASM